MAGAPATSDASANLASTLRARLDGHVTDDLATRDTWALGGVVPGLVARPGDPSEVAATVAAVAEVGAALVPLGRGAHRGLGHPPRRYDLALVCDRLNRVRDYTPHDMTVTVEAGVTLADLATLLAGEGQWLPVDPPLPAETTVGGLLAADLAGSLAASQGRIRDYLIGISLVTADGVPARAGGRVVKNVAGYDLMKLFIGSLGTLAVATEATFKVRPLPEVQRCLGFVVRDLAEAFALGASAAAAIQEPLAVTVTSGAGDEAGGATVIVRLGGTTSDVAAARARLLALVPQRATALAFDADATEPMGVAALQRGRDFPRLVPGSMVVRLAALPARLPALAAELARVVDMGAGAWHADLLRGVLVFAPASVAPEPMLATLARLTDAHGAHCVLERWPLALASTVDVWRPLPPALPLMRRMKAALDPRNTFAPGRFVGGS